MFVERSIVVGSPKEGENYRALVAPLYLVFENLRFSFFRE